MKSENLLRVSAFEQRKLIKILRHFWSDFENPLKFFPFMFNSRNFGTGLGLPKSTTYINYKEIGEL